MEITSQAINLLRFVVSVDGKKELDKEEREVDSPRRLNGDESAQRRFFIREIDALNERIKPEAQAIVDVYNSLLEKKREAFRTANPKAEGETDEVFDKRMGETLSKDEELQKSYADVQAKDKVFMALKHKLELREKTVAFLKKYFVEFGDKVGYLQGDDQSVEELNGVFGIEA